MTLIEKTCATVGISPVGCLEVTVRARSVRAVYTGRPPVIWLRP